jgi:hypothetical protein
MCVFSYVLGSQYTLILINALSYSNQTAIIKPVHRCNYSLRHTSRQVIRGFPATFRIPRLFQIQPEIHISLVALHDNSSSLSSCIK